jgi:hypothetical protein
MTNKLFTKEELLRWQTDEAFQLELIKENKEFIQYINIIKYPELYDLYVLMYS